MPRERNAAKATASAGKESIAGSTGILGLTVMGFVRRGVQDRSFLDRKCNVNDKINNIFGQVDLNILNLIVHLKKICIMEGFIQNK